jgi:flagellar hook protein FlgE
MSLFGAMNTAVSGLNGQSTAFGNISEDVSNSQTVGFKRVDTSFNDLLTQSTPTENTPGSVEATPDYVNNVQGALTQTDNPLGMAITGNGFFTVSKPIGQANNLPTFNSQQYYTRAGDFTMNSNGYLVNSAGNYLNAWSVDPTTGAVDQNNLAPVKVSQSPYTPVPTANVSLSANLPATPTSGTATVTSPLTSQVTVYDALGTAHTISLNWSQNAADDWNVQVSVPDAVTGPGNTNGATDAGTADVQFGALSGNAVAEGTIGSVAVSGSDAGTMTAGSYAAGQPATVSFTTNFGNGSQTINLNLGDFGGSSGVTQFAGTSYSMNGLTQDGIAAGNYTGITTQNDGNIVLNYSNGQTKTIAQIPLTTFADPNALQSQNGQAFTATQASGAPLTQATNSGSAGSLVVGSVEGSNVNIANEFSQLIVAQQSYSSNAKVVTTADQMLQTTIQMIA